MGHCVDPIKSWTLPHPELRPFIDRYWSWRGDTSCALPTLLPGTGAELFFHIDQPLLIASPSGHFQRVPQAHLQGCMRHAPQTLRADAPFDFISVRVRSGALRHLCVEPPGGICEEPLPLEALWGPRVRTLQARISESPDMRSRAQALDDWLRFCLHQHRRGLPLLDDAVNHLYYRHRTTRIEDLAEHYRISRRHFERIFKAELGCTPKAFLRTARFHQTMRDLFLAARGDYLSLALDHGYYDQSHFIHEFSSFVGKSPALFFDEQRFATHFYNPSLALRLHTATHQSER